MWMPISRRSNSAMLASSVSIKRPGTFAVFGPWVARIFTLSVMWPPRKKAAFLHRWRPSLIGTGTRPLDSPDRRCSRQNFYGSVNHFTLCLILPAVCLNQVERGDAVSENVALAVYAACGFLIVVYAWGRSHAKPCNLAITLLAYLALGGPLFAQAAALTHQLAGGLTATGRIAHIQLLTIGMVVWLMQRQAYLTPAPGEPPRFSAQIANSLIAVVTAGGICFVFHSGTEDPVIGTERDLRVILLSFPLCAAVAFFRDHWAPDASRLGWLRRVEAAGCTSVMALPIGLLYFGALFPSPPHLLQGWKLAVLLGMTSMIALTIGGCVPARSRVEVATADDRIGVLQ